MTNAQNRGKCSHQRETQQRNERSGAVPDDAVAEHGARVLQQQLRPVVPEALAGVDVAVLHGVLQRGTAHGILRNTGILSQQASVDIGHC